MLTAIMTFLGTPFGRKAAEVVAGIVMVAAMLGEIYHAGSKHEAAKNEKIQAAAVADVKAHEAQGVVISSKASGDLAVAQNAVTVKYRTLIQRVPVDVPEGADRDCVIPTGFISSWNAGASQP